jgi:hypothetical protein
MYKNNSPVTLNAKLQSLAKDINDISSMLEKKQITPKQLAFYYSGDPDQPVNVSNIKKNYLANKDGFVKTTGGAKITTTTTTTTTRITTR